MRRHAIRWAAPLLLWLLTLVSSAPAKGPDFQPAGRWVLVNDWGWPIDVAILDVKSQGDHFDVRLIAGRGKLKTGKLESYACHDGHVTFTLVDGSGSKTTFDGKFAADGRFAGQVVGATHGRFVDPARLQRTSAEQLTYGQSQLPYQQQIDDAAGLKDVRERTGRYFEIVMKHPGPETQGQFLAVLTDAERANLSKEQVHDLLGPWFSSAEVYGPAFLATSRQVVLNALHGQREYASLAFDVADEGRKHLADLSPKGQASFFHFFASAAELTGRAEVAATARTQAAEIDARLDAEYREKVPGFPVERYAGRPHPEDNRTVLVELFTGTRCPPCVAADVACDALGSAFRPSELILLQYHLHIPSPDPLVNPSALARAKYYETGATPTAFFNGEEFPGGGGPLPAAKMKYDQYRQRIEPLLAQQRRADIDLSVRRTAGSLAIRVSASATSADGRAPRPSKDSAGPEKNRQLRLRLVLTEESIRYDGGNGVRFNHHVVRDFPGGPHGMPLRNGRIDLKLTTDLDHVRAGLEEYRHSIASRLSFFCWKPLPELALKRLTLVAFIQDDATRRVLHAVSAAVPDE